MLVLLVLILRTVALEFRSKEQSPRWRSTWDAVFGLASLGLALLLGIAFGNVVSGLPVDADGNFSSGLTGLLTPFALLVGVTTAAMFSVQGGIYLMLKTEGELHDRIARTVPRLMIAFFVLNTLVVIAMVLFHQEITERYIDGHLAGHLPGGRARRARRGVAVGPARRGVQGVPVLVRDDRAAADLGRRSGSIRTSSSRRLDPAYSLTIFNAASAENTLEVALVIAADRDPVRAPVHGRRLLHLPGQDRRRPHGY